MLGAIILIISLPLDCLIKVSRSLYYFCMFPKKMLIGFRLCRILYYFSLPVSGRFFQTRSNWRRSTTLQNWMIFRQVFINDSQILTLFSSLIFIESWSSNIQFSVQCSSLTIFFYLSFVLYSPFYVCIKIDAFASSYTNDVVRTTGNVQISQI